MAYSTQFRAAFTTLALTGAMCLSNAYADDNGLYNWQPCPASLAEEGGAQPTKKWDLTLSPYTYHWHYNAEHRPVKLVAMNSYVAGERFCGMAVFTNSFGQASTYLYVGKQWNGILGDPKLFSKVSAGLIWGYRGAYKNKIPFNQLGIAPAIIPSLGYAFTPKDSAEVFLLGTAGLTFSYTRSF